MHPTIIEANTILTSCSIFDCMTSRYFIRLAYNGSKYCGWQIQTSDRTVQGTIEAVLSKIYNRELQVVGCGRTDAGVHASDYKLHVDLTDKYDISDLVYKINNMLPIDIRIYDITKVPTDAHARYDATSRSYIYKMVFGRDPFRQDTVYRYDQSGRPDLELMREAANLILEYKDFFPFCKTHADNDTYLCKLTESRWEEISDHEWHYSVTSDRFLRGMVRMIVGMTLNVGLARTSIDEVRIALEKQERLVRAWSVPAQSLYLSNITYPFLT